MFSETVIIDKDLGIRTRFSKWSLDSINIKKKNNQKNLISECVDAFLNKGRINNVAK